MSLLFAYYGDDFTGSTDALEALATGGMRAVLFLGIPTEVHQKQFTGFEAMGVAGESRSRSPEWMDQFLPDIFRWIHSLGAPIVQYKVCSTFDSAPEIGNIGVAMKIGREVFRSSCVPIVVAAPHLGRYVVFGNLFAAGTDGICRIDRHPTMRQHPITPMRESDLRLHLKQQSPDCVELLDILTLAREDSPQAYKDVLGRNPQGILFDGLDERSELATGRLLWANRTEQPFVVGSSGFTHALMRHWREGGLIPDHFSPAQPAPVDRMIAVSGSCSPVTAAQIQYALSNGFEGLCTSALDGEGLLRSGLEILARGHSLVIYSALGSHDLRGSLSGDALGRHLGKVLHDLVRRSGVRRILIAGGDTSSHAATQLGIHALTFAAPMAPGSPLCRAHSDDTAMDGLELVLKGGQVGGVNFFEVVRKGKI